MSLFGNTVEKDVLKDHQITASMIKDNVRFKAFLTELRANKVPQIRKEVESMSTLNFGSRKIFLKKVIPPILSELESIINQLPDSGVKADAEAQHFKWKKIREQAEELNMQNFASIKQEILNAFTTYDDKLDTLQKTMDEVNREEIRHQSELKRIYH